MCDDAILALDLGTSGCRAEVYSLEGVSLGWAYEEYELLSPEPGAAEQDAEGWWRALVRCARKALSGCRAGACTPPEKVGDNGRRGTSPRPTAEAGETRAVRGVGDNGRRGTSPRPTAEAGETPAVRILGIGISAQGHSWVPVDGGLRPLRKAMTWLDARAEGQARRLLEDHPLEFWGKHAGKQPGQWHLLPQLLWLREHEPETVAVARRYLFAHDYILMRLTGEVVTDYTTAAGSLLFDLREWGWSSELLAEYGVEEGLLPRIVPAGTVAGKLTAEAAEGLGLTGDVVVAVGAQDQKCAALAAGLDEATATASLGTATAIIARVAEPRFEAQHGLIPCFPFLKPGEWILEAPLATTGGALRWLRDLLGKTGAEGYAEMTVSAQEVPPGAEGTVCVPYLAGAGSPYWCGTATGSFHGLTLRTGQGHLTRALLEAVAYDIAANLEHMKALGCRIDRLVLFGGGARSELWPQIIGAVCGVPTYSSVESEAAVRGAAMLAAEALGVEAGVFAMEAAEVRVPERWAEAYEGLGHLTGAAYEPTQRGACN